MQKIVVIERISDAERLKRVAFEQLRQWEQEGRKRAKMTLFCDDSGHLCDIHIDISIKNRGV